MDEATDRRPLGHVWSYDGETEPRILFGDILISNSIAFSPDGGLMYFADTPRKKIFVHDYDLHKGAVSNRRLFAEVEPAAVSPTGRPSTPKVFSGTRNGAARA